MKSSHQCCRKCILNSIEDMHIKIRNEGPNTDLGFLLWCDALNILSYEVTSVHFMKLFRNLLETMKSSSHSEKVEQTTGKKITEKG